MPTTNERDGMSREEAIQALYAEYGIRPISGGSGKGEGDGDGSGDDGKGGDGGKGGEGAGAGGAGGAGGEGENGGKGGEDVSGLKKALDSERKTNEAVRKFAGQRGLKVADLLKQFEAKENEGKSEVERLTGERDTLKTTAADYQDKYRRIAAAETVRSKAIELGADPRRVDRIVRLVKPDLEYGEDDAPTNVAKLLTDLKRSDADLFAAVVGKGDGGAGGGGKPKEDQNAALRQAFGRTG